MLIDCDSCVAKDIACDDCVISVILQDGLESGAPVRLDPEEEEALSALAAAGLVPQLRLIPRTPEGATVETWKDSAAG